RRLFLRDAHLGTQFQARSFAIPKARDLFRARQSAPQGARGDEGRRIGEVGTTAAAAYRTRRGFSEAMNEETPAAKVPRSRCPSAFHHRGSTPERPPERSRAAAQR